jgi:hypothetical protein
VSRSQTRPWGYRVSVFGVHAGMCPFECVRVLERGLAFRRGRGGLARLWEVAGSVRTTPSR